MGYQLEHIMNLRTILLLACLLSPDHLYGGTDPLALTGDMKVWLSKNGYFVVHPFELVQVPREWIKELTGRSESYGACWDGVIYLSEELTFDTPIEQALILHEMVHLAQNECSTPKSYAERVRVEREAYQMQGKWFTEKTGRKLHLDPQASLRKTRHDKGQ